MLSSAEWPSISGRSGDGAHQGGILNRIILPAITYALTVFAMGFLFGAIRVLLVAPQTGEVGAVLIEVPIMVLVSFLFARRTIRRWQVPAELQVRLAVGAMAFAVLMACEVLLSLTLFGNTLSLYFAQYTQPQAWLGLAAQLVFAVMPVLLLRDEHG